MLPYYGLLVESTVYEAISYTWGEPIFSASIECFCPEGQLLITENLSKGLFHLRFEDGIRVLWIDAICINQQDLAERSHQVTLLRDTFERADNVIVWLGEDTGDANEAFEALQTIDSSLTESEAFDIVFSERGKALIKLLERSWFRRIWVVQELICARKATITCGNHAMDWEKFLDLAGTMRLMASNLSFEDRIVPDVLTILICMKKGWERRKQREKTTLEELLCSYRRCLATDPRDKVFALVEMASGQNGTAYTPTYYIDVIEVYRNLAIHLIIAERNPNALVHCAHMAGSQAPYLPSWVPDWSQRLESNCSPLNYPGTYNAAAGTSFKGRLSEDLSELSLDGMLLSNVEALGEAWELDLRRYDLVKRIKTQLERNEEYLDMFRQSPRYGGFYWSAFTRALVADKDHTGKRVGQRDLNEVYITYRKLLSGCLVSRVTRRLSYYKNSIEEKEFSAVRYFELAIGFAGHGRTFCILDDGRAGWVPRTAEVSDRIAIFLGATVPILLRSRGNGYIVLGEAYVHEMMDGQAFEGPDVQIEIITLI